MGRKLNATVLLDGEIYPAGTDESDVRGEITALGVWDGEPDEASDPTGDDDLGELPGGPNSDLFKAVVVGVLALHLENPDAPVGPLFLSVLAEQGFEVPQPDAPATPAGDGQGDQSATYGELSKPELEAEIDKRNTDRDPGSEAFIRPEGRNKPDLVAALLVDDARTAGETPES